MFLYFIRNLSLILSAICSFSCSYSSHQGSKKTYCIAEESFEGNSREKRTAIPYLAPDMRGYVLKMGAHQDSMPYYVPRHAQQDFAIGKKKGKKKAKNLDTFFYSCGHLPHKESRKSYSLPDMRGYTLGTGPHQGSMPYYVPKQAPQECVVGGKKEKKKESLYIKERRLP